MASKPLIGITGRRKRGDQMLGFLEHFADFPIDLYYADYGRGILEAGGLPVHIPLDVDPIDLVSCLNGVLLTGGADVDPRRYGQESSTDMFPPESIRDEQESAVLDAAYVHQIPVAGICRGLQLINVHSGGTLHQDVPSHAGFSEPVTTEWHKVTFEADTVLGEIYGRDRAVNSLHHQTVDRVGEDLHVSARSDDGSIEGLEHSELPVVAVQWHPEMLATRTEDPLFAWLVSKASNQHRVDNRQK